MRVATGAIRHETNTFSTVATDLDKYRQSTTAGGILLGDDITRAFRGTHTEQGGFLEVAEKEGLELIPTLWASATPSGLVTRHAFDYMMGEMLSRLRAAGTVDGVLLDLHGAMVLEDDEDAEGAIISAVRDVVGTSVPIIVTLNLHANITERMAEKADALIGYDTYPHVDSYERGMEAAHLMARVLRGEARLAMALRKLPLLTAPPAHRTGRYPMTLLIDRAHALEQEPGIASVTVAAGFPFADIAAAGMSIVVVASDGDLAKAEAKATALGDEAWSLRHKFTDDAVPVREAVARAMAAPEGPIVLADQSDNPGGGAPADGTAILSALLELGARRAVVAPMADPEAVAAAIAAGVGSRVTMRVGGKTDDRHGAPVEVTGQVRVIADGTFIRKGPMSTGVEASIGRTVVLDCGGVELLLTEKRLQANDVEMLRFVGIEPTDRQILVLKSAVHYRAAFEPIAKGVIEVDSPGIHSPRIKSFTFRKLRRPIYPLDEI